MAAGSSDSCLREVGRGGAATKIMGAACREGGIVLLDKYHGTTQHMSGYVGGPDHYAQCGSRQET
jgi:hypothetical protein